MNDRESIDTDQLLGYAALEAKLNQRFEEFAAHHNRTIGLLHEGITNRTEQIQDKITAHNSHISEAVIEKTFKLFVPIMAILGVLLALFGWLGYDDIKTGIANYTRAKVDQWLSYDEPSSPLNRDLREMRDRYLIDTLYVRHLRAKSDSYRHYKFEITDKELADLIRIANSKETPLKDYEDILEIYASSNVLGSIKYSGIYRGDMFGDVFTKDGFLEQRRKQRAFLEAFSHDGSVYGIAKAVIEREDEFLLEEAFRLLANLHTPDAVRYANAHLQANRFESFDLEMALVLARQDIQSPALAAYIEAVGASRDIYSGWLHAYMRLLTPIIQHKSDVSFGAVIDKQEDQLRSDLALKMFAKLVEFGCSIDIQDRYDERISIGDQSGNIRGLSRWEVNRIYDKPDVLRDLVSMRPNDAPWIEQVVTTLEVTRGDEYLVTIMVDLSEDSEIGIPGQQRVRSSDVKGEVWFTVNRRDSGKLEISYRDKAGAYRRETILSLSGMEGVNFNYRYRKQDLYAYLEKDDYFD